MVIRAIVTDIEGTTTDIDFVHRVLFPYSRSQMASFIADHAEDSGVVEALRVVREQVGDLGLSNSEVAEVLVKWIDEDRKYTPLKTLQGRIWEGGYRRGDFKGHLYDDAVDGLRQWHGRGISLFVYSSGSVAAQKLLFGYSEAGDLTPLFKGYFDTTTGPKREVLSYQKIAKAIGEVPRTILFLSDVEAELDAAAEVGFQTYLLDRQQQMSESKHRIAHHFGAVCV